MTAQNRTAVSAFEQSHFLVSALGQATPIVGSGSSPDSIQPAAKPLRNLLGVRCPETASAMSANIAKVIQSRRPQVMRLQNNRDDGPGILLNIQPAREPDIAVVRVIPLEAPPPLPSAQLLGELFGLTPSEAAITLALAQDLSLCAIAEQRGSSLETVRGHVKVIFRKTGVSSQKQLVRIVTQIGASIGG